MKKTKVAHPLLAHVKRAEQNPVRLLHKLRGCYYDDFVAQKGTDEKTVNEVTMQAPQPTPEQIQELVRDVSSPKPGCPLCRGTGINGYIIRASGTKRERQWTRSPRPCRCRLFGSVEFDSVRKVCDAVGTKGRRVMRKIARARVRLLQKHAEAQPPTDILV